MVFYWSLSDSKSPQLSRTLLSIQAIFNNALVWIFSTRPPTFKSSSAFSNPLDIVSKQPIPISIIVIFTFHHVFLFPLQGRRTYSSYILSVTICCQPGQQIRKVCEISSFFSSFFIIIMSGLLDNMRWSISTSKSHILLLLLLFTPL